MTPDTLFKNKKSHQYHSIQLASFILIYIYFYVTVDTACQALEQSHVHSKSVTTHWNQSGYYDILRVQDTWLRLSNLLKDKCNYIIATREKRDGVKEGWKWIEIGLNSQISILILRQVA